MLPTEVQSFPKTPNRIGSMVLQQTDFVVVVLNMQNLVFFVLFFSAAADSSPPPKLFMLHLMKVYLEIISHSSWNETNAIHFSKKSAYQHKPEVTNAASEAHQLFTATPKLQSQKEL